MSGTISQPFKLKVKLNCTCCEDCPRKRLKEILSNVGGVEDFMIDAPSDQVIVTGKNVNIEMLINKVKELDKEVRLEAVLVEEEDAVEEPLPAVEGRPGHYKSAMKNNSHKVSGQNRKTKGKNVRFEDESNSDVKNHTGLKSCNCCHNEPQGAGCEKCVHGGKCGHNAVCGTNTGQGHEHSFGACGIPHKNDGHGHICGVNGNSSGLFCAGHSEDHHWRCGENQVCDTLHNHLGCGELHSENYQSHPPCMVSENHVHASDHSSVHFGALDVAAGRTFESMHQTPYKTSRDFDSVHQNYSSRPEVTQQ